MSMKTDSAVALKQLGTQSVTVRTRTAAQKLNYLRELIYDDPQVEPNLYLRRLSKSGRTNEDPVRRCSEGVSEGIESSIPFYAE